MWLNDIWLKLSVEGAPAGVINQTYFINIIDEMSLLHDEIRNKSYLFILFHHKF